MGNKKGLVCLFASFVLLLASCSNGMLDFASGKKSSGDNSTVKTEKAYLVIGSATVAEFSEGGSRTVFEPDETENLTDFVLTGSLQGSESENVEEMAASLEELQGITLELIPGTWNFTLSAKLEGIEFVGKRESIAISGGTSDVPNTISFILESTVKFGGLSVNVEFTDSTSSVEYVNALLYKGSVKEENLVDSTRINKGADGESNFSKVSYTKNITVASSASSGSPVAESSSGLEKGIYWLVFDFWAADLDKPLNSIPYCVYVADGITTRYTEKEEIDINETHTITYYDNGGTLKSGTKVFKFSRKSGTITLPKMQKEGFFFAGWYTDEAFKGEPLTEIHPGSRENYTLYARYINGSSGRVSLDNNVLTISIVNSDGNKLSDERIAEGFYLNETIRVCARDINSSIVQTEGFDVSILYKGKKLEVLKDMPENYFYPAHVDSDSIGYGNIQLLGKIVENGVEVDMQPVPAGNYQLEISAYSNVDGSVISARDTFPIKIKNMLYFSFDYTETSGNLSTMFSDYVESYGGSKYSCPINVKLTGYVDTRDSSSINPFIRLGELFDQVEGIKAYNSYIDMSAISGVGDKTYGQVTIGDNYFNNDINIGKFNNLVGIKLPSATNNNYDGGYGIGDSAFYNCYNLSEVSIPVIVESIGKGAFGGCDALSKVEFKDPNNWYKSTTTVDVTNTEAVTALKVETNKVDFNDPEKTAKMLSGSLYYDDSTPSNENLNTYYLYYLPDYDEDDTVIEG